MKVEPQGNVVRVSAIRELGAGNANALRDDVRRAMGEGVTHVEVDLSETTFIDSCGLGSLIAIHKTACSRNGCLRLLNPQQQVWQILRLTRMDRIFEVVKPS